MQVLSPAVNIAGMGTPALLAAAPAASPLTVIRQVVDAGGVRGLYRGGSFDTNFKRCQLPPRGQHTFGSECQHYEYFLVSAGMVPTLGREVGGSAAMFATYELTKRKFAQAQVHPILLFQ